jgi:Docking domain of Afi1 for Arf3 in vesicle trafficking
MTSSSPVVDYVLAAEFDIDKGSLVSFQYPRPTGCDEGLLAEWMVNLKADLASRR